MNTFFMFGKYSAASLREIHARRTAQVNEWITKNGGRVCQTYALMGEYDVVFIVELPSMTDAMKAAVALGRMTGISFSTCAAMQVEEFDRMSDELETEIESARMEAGE